MIKPMMRINGPAYFGTPVRALIQNLDIASPNISKSIREGWTKVFDAACKQRSFFYSYAKKDPKKHT